MFFYSQPVNPTDVYLPAVDSDKAVLTLLGGHRASGSEGLGKEECGRTLGLTNRSSFSTAGQPTANPADVCLPTVYSDKAVSRMGGEGS